MPRNKQIAPGSKLCTCKWPSRCDKLSHRYCLNVPYCNCTCGCASKCSGCVDCDDMFIQETDTQMELFRAKDYRA